MRNLQQRLVPAREACYTRATQLDGGLPKGEATNDRQGGLGARASLRAHWPEYAMELAEMAVYLSCTCVFATLLQHPASPIRHLVPSVMVRRATFGILIGTTLTVIILTPWGQQSGGHLNPAMTWTFYRLHKLEFRDAVFYGVAQFAGATGGVAIAAILLHGAPAHPAIRYAATLPGSYGARAAFAAEVVMSFALMLVVLSVSTSHAKSCYTPYLVGALYAIFITFEAPLSGMSMNPARTFGPAFLGHYWHAIWVYLSRPRVRHVACCRTISLVALWQRSALRQTPSRERQALHFLLRLPVNREDTFSAVTGACLLA